MMIVQCSVRFEQGCIQLWPNWEQSVSPLEALALLLNSSAAHFGRAESDELVPCFDVDELRRRNSR